MTNSFNKTHFEDLQKIVGSENIFIDSPHLSVYSFDSTRLERQPQCVIFPRNEEEIVQIVQYANQYCLSLTPRGAGSGMSGGSVNYGIILALQKHLNKILEIDCENLCVRVQPALINGALNQELKSYGLFFPPDPASSAFSTIGGNIAENAGGMSAVKYGVSRDNLMAMRVVLGSGELIEIGHKTYKDVSGYDLLGLMCGSEGTLGIMTELTLKLKPIPKYSTSLLICFDCIENLVHLACQILSCGILPYAMEFLDALTINALNQKYHIYPKNAQAVLIVKLTSHTRSGLDEELQQLKALASNCLKYQEAKTQEEEEEIWFGRKNASQANTIYGVKKLNEDITLPRSRVAEFLQITQEISKQSGFKIPCFGHIGDGNIHTNVMLGDLKDLQKGYEVVRQLFENAISLGGTLSGEHGIGLTKSSFMSLAFSQTHLKLFENIKDIFDPKGVLNPNKIF